jgi:hypothetical protein
LLLCIARNRSRDNSGCGRDAPVDFAASAGADGAPGINGIRWRHYVEATWLRSRRRCYASPALRCVGAQYGYLEHPPLATVVPTRPIGALSGQVCCAE